MTVMRCMPHLFFLVQFLQGSSNPEVRREKDDDSQQERDPPRQGACGCRGCRGPGAAVGPRQAPCCVSVKCSSELNFASSGQ
jgi:hypothetical protein